MEKKVYDAAVWGEKKRPKRPFLGYLVRTAEIASVSLDIWCYPSRKKLESSNKTKACKVAKKERSAGQTGRH